MGTSIRQVLVAAVIVLAPAAAAAQDGAVLSGVVYDPSGTPTPGVVVTVTHPERNAVRVVVTNLQGEYRLEGLEEGTEYRVEVSHPKFRKLRVTIPVVRGQTPVVTRLNPRKNCVLNGR